MTNTSATAFVYVTYIRTTPEKLWSALTDAEFMKRYWFGMHIDTDWKRGSPWRLVFTDGRLADAGEVIEADAPKRLAIKWRNEWNPVFKAEGYSRCVFDIESVPGAAKLTVTHTMDRLEFETDRSRVGRLAAHPLELEIAPGDGGGRPDRKNIDVHCS